MLNSSSLSVLQFYLLLLQLLNSLAPSFSSSGPHIADVNILLPPKMTRPVEYRLQGSDGCFKWSWDHHDILSVHPEYNASNHCSTSARLRSIAPYSGRKETAVYATDVRTGIVIRCKVYIDNFSSIKIFHNSIKLDLDGLATLRMRAFDDEDNVFSSLVGLQFMWQLVPEADGMPHHLVHVPLKDSPMSDCGGLCGDLDIQINLEDSGVFSDLYVVKGIEIGHEDVFVNLAEPHFEHLSDKIALTVAEAMSLEPSSPLFVLPGSTIRYCLKVIRGGIPQVVNLPSPYHHWSVSNSSVARVDMKMGFAKAVNLGITSITVEDSRVTGHLQISSLHVVTPESIHLYLLPLSSTGDLIDGVKHIPSVSRWNVVSGRQYLIQMKVFSQGPGAQEIYLTESDDINLLGEQSDYWSVRPVSGYPSVREWLLNSKMLLPLSFGRGKLMASLTHSTGNDEKETLKIVQELLFCDEVKLSIVKSSNISPSILLPWAPGIYQELELKVIGGCGKVASDYKWFSSDVDIVSVSAYGVLQAKKPGKAVIKVVSIIDQLNFDEVATEVSVPYSMTMLPEFSVETIVGSHIEAAVTMKSINGAFFDRCDAFYSAIKWKLEGQSFKILNTSRESIITNTLAGPPCAWANAYAASPGRALLCATLSKEFEHFDRPLPENIMLKASSRIAAYSPLIVHQAGNGNQYGGYWFDQVEAEVGNEMENLKDLYLVPGTCMDVMLRGGPEPWDQGVDFIESVEIFSEDSELSDGILLYQIPSSYGQYRISCQKLGAFKIVFKRGNMVRVDHPKPAIAEVLLLLSCNFPSTLVLIIDSPENTFDVILAASQAGRGPGRMRESPVTVANGRTLRISAVGLSDSGKPFGNSSFLHLKWELSNCDGLASWDNAIDLTSSKFIWDKSLILHNDSGMCTVRASATGYFDAIGDHQFALPFQSVKSNLTDAIYLQLVSTLRLDPTFSLLFFSPDALLNISVAGGSCFLKVLVNDSQVAEVIKPPSSLQCSQLVLAPKGLGTAIVSVKDIGLSPPLAASSVIVVADVDWIKITLPEELRLMEGGIQSIHVSAGTDSGRTFDTSQLVYMNMQIHFEDQIIELVDDDSFLGQMDGYANSRVFTVRARHIGITNLYVSTRQLSGRELLSQPIRVEVYIPPKIHPSDIFLVPGASYTVTVKGGPIIAAYVEYDSLNDRTATIHRSAGRLFAVSPGNTTVVARIYGGEGSIICTTYGQVKVGIPSLVGLTTQSDRLAVGSEMPIYPHPLEGNLFSFYELCKDYKWSVENYEVLSFTGTENLFDEKTALPNSSKKEETSSAYLGKDLGFIALLYGRSGGRTEVSISFSCDFNSSGSFSHSRSYNSSLSIWVVSNLPLSLGAPLTWLLPPHYTSSDLLPSSSKSKILYSLLRQCGENNEELHREAISIDGNRVVTTESDILGCIQAKDRLTGRIEVASCIRVAEVAQIRIITSPLSSRSIDLALGTEIDLPISYHDDLGMPFREAYGAVTFSIESNYPDIITINGTSDGNGIIHVKALKNGRALLRISFNNNPPKSDYVMISVGAHLYPQNALLHIGAQLNFSVEGLDAQIHGHWLSANKSIVFVDQFSGKAEATGEGATEVIFEYSGMKLKTAVRVLKGTNVLVTAPKGTLTNAPFPAKGYGFLVNFSGSGSHSHKYESPEKSLEFSYDCRVEPPYVGYVKPWKDLDAGASYCLFFPYSPEHLVYSMPVSKDVKRQLAIYVIASLKEANHISGSASAIFISGFSILEMDKLNLNGDSKSTTINIVGNTDVEVHSHEKDQLLIIPIHNKNFGVSGHAQYEVKVLRRDEKFKDKIIITLPANEQRVEIDVNYEGGGGREMTAGRFASNYYNVTSMIGCFVLLILTVGLYIIYLDKPERRRRDHAPITPLTGEANTSTPNNNRRRDHSSSSSPLKNDQSPRTPPAFMEYVRRTIDETPYYRRDGRRFDLQNTF
ncbi:nuclear pore complex protein GP210 [Impatiens glandulifera]|uniref:nuclear pore complex protein GP210 n=1 Tax=Impatiens glandulifera TaxID=253017 RepID=UPI001FB0C94E|nr:nuclear pore complex protein GP210 [Impatiens glandulifera]